MGRMRRLNGLAGGLPKVEGQDFPSLRARPRTPAPQAAKALGLDVRTVRRMIAAGELEGGSVAKPQRKQWFVYSDQLPGASARTAPVPPEMGAELAALRAENADLRARAVSAEEGERLLLAGHQQLRDAVRESQAILAAMLSAQAHVDRGVEGYRVAAEGFQQAAEEFRQGTQDYLRAVQRAHATMDLLSAVADGYSDTISQHITPGHAGGL